MAQSQGQKTTKLMETTLKIMDFSIKNGEREAQHLPLKLSNQQLSHWNYLPASCGDFWARPAPPPVKTRRSFPPGEDQRIDKWNEEG